jgi:hypothetical protein
MIQKNQSFFRFKTMALDSIPTKKRIEMVSKISEKESINTKESLIFRVTQRQEVYS